MPLQISERRFNQSMVVFVALGFLAVLAAGVASGIVVGLAGDRTRWVIHTYEVERHIDSLRLQLRTMEETRRGYLLDHDASFQANFVQARNAVDGEVDAIARLTEDNPREQANIRQLRTEVAALRTRLETSMQEALLGHDARAVAAFETDGSVEAAQRVDETAAAMMAEENRLLAIRAKAQSDFDGAFYVVLGASGVLVVLVAIGSLLVIIRYTRALAGSRDELRQLNDNLEQAVQERTVDLQRANDEIQRFAYIVSHDLRSPLVNVLGFTSELDASVRPLGRMLERTEAEAPHLADDDARRAVREDIPEAIAFIRGSTQKMDRLINAILKLSREGRRVINAEPLDMDALAQGVADSLQHRVAELGAEITVAKPLPSVVSDRVSVEQILSNLAENAVKYLKPGRPGRIRISGHRERNRVIYEVQDNGRGIDPRDHERIFDLFRRSGVQDQPGEGIGLAHVRASAYRLGGVVACESELDRGATFRLSLPASFSEESRS